MISTIRRAILGDGSRRVLIEYEDAQGVKSERIVVPLALAGNDGANIFNAVHLFARCETARAQRTFRLDRIIAMADASTGEVITLRRWLDTLQLGDAEPQEGFEPEAPPSEAIVATGRRRRGVGVSWVLLALSTGYLIGRFRLVRWILRSLHQHWGLWL